MIHLILLNYHCVIKLYKWLKPSKRLIADFKFSKLQCKYNSLRCSLVFKKVLSLIWILSLILFFDRFKIFNDLFFVHASNKVIKELSFKQFCSKLIF